MFDPTMQRRWRRVPIEDWKKSDGTPVTLEVFDLKEEELRVLASNPGVYYSQRAIQVSQNNQASSIDEVKKLVEENTRNIEGVEIDGKPITTASELWPHLSRPQVQTLCVVVYHSNLIPEAEAGNSSPPSDG